MRLHGVLVFFRYLGNDMGGSGGVGEAEIKR